MKALSIVVAGVVGLAVAVTGCEKNAPVDNSRTGVTVVVGEGKELPIGAMMKDFEFTDQNEQLRRLQDIKGAFTVLAFTECKASYKPTLTNVSKLMDQVSNWDTKIIGVDVFWTPEGCVPAQQCSSLPDDLDNFFAICDQNGQVRRKYGAESGRYFIIGPYGKIMAKGNLQNYDNFKGTLNDLVAKYQADRAALDSPR